MKFCTIGLLSFIFTLMTIDTSLTFAQEDPSGPKRIAPRRPIGKLAKATTTTPSPPAYDDGDYVDENVGYEDGADGEEGAAITSSTTTTTTEAPKKIGPVIRPFRSNDDFLNSLKRRQMDAKKHRAEKPTPRSKPAPVPDDDEEEVAAAPSITPTKGFKPGLSSSNRRKPGKTAGRPDTPIDDVVAEESEHQKDESKVKRPPLPRLNLRKRS